MFTGCGKRGKRLGCGLGQGWVAGLGGDFNMEGKEFTEEEEDKSGTTGSSPKNGCVGSATSMGNGSIECC